METAIRDVLTAVFRAMPDVPDALREERVAVVKQKSSVNIQLGLRMEKLLGNGLRDHSQLRNIAATSVTIWRDRIRHFVRITVPGVVLHLSAMPFSVHNQSKMIMSKYLTRSLWVMHLVKRLCMIVKTVIQWWVKGVVLAKKASPEKESGQELTCSANR